MKTIALLLMIVTLLACNSEKRNKMFPRKQI